LKVGSHHQGVHEGGRCTTIEEVLMKINSDSVQADISSKIHTTTYFLPEQRIMQIIICWKIIANTLQ
jgi:hypothetical protein